MSLPQSVIVKTDDKFNFLSPGEISQGTTSGYSSKTITAQPPNGSASDFTSKTFQLTANNWVDSDHKLRGILKFRLYKTNTAGTAGVDVAPAELKNNIGLSSYAWNRSISSAKVEFSGMSQSTSVNEYVELYANSLDKETAMLISPVSAPDHDDQFTSGANNDPLRWEASSEMVYSNSRGFGQNYKVSVEEVAAGQLPAPLDAEHYIVSVEYDEKLMAQPFQFLDKDSPQPFYGLGSYKIYLDFMNDPLNHMVKLNQNLLRVNNGTVAQPVLNKYAVSLSNIADPWNLKIVQTTFIPHLSIDPPSVLYYNSPQIDNYSRDVNGTIAAGNSTTDWETLNSFTLNGLPSMFCLSVQDRESFYDPFRPNRTMALTQVSIQLGSQSSILSEYNVRDLYDLSRRNGYRNGFNSFSCGENNPVAKDEGAGSNCYLFFRLADLGTEQNVVSNSNAQVDMTVKVKYENNTADAVNARIQLYAINDNVVINEAGNWKAVKPLLTYAQISSGKKEYEDMNQVHNILGGRKGKFWRGLKNFVTSKGVRNVVKGLRKSPLGAVLPGAVHTVAEIAGYGVERKAAGMVRSAGKRKAPAKRRGAGVVRSAGKKMTKAQMKKKYGL